jgi:hypothetical protein
VSFWKAIKEIDRIYQIILVGFILTFFGGVIGALISEMKTVVDFISAPFVILFTNLHPGENTADFFKIVYAAICVIFYAAIIVFPFACFSAINRVKENAQDNTGENLEINLYSEEVAAAIEVLERPNLSTQEQDDTLEDFLRKISNTIFSSFPGVNLANVRYAFLLSPPSSSSLYSAVKLGRNGSLTDDDNKVIEWILTNISDDFYIQGDIKSVVQNVTAGYDMNTVGLVRNSGNKFRFGFVIFLPNSDAFSDFGVIDNFIVNSSAIRLMAHMDKLWDPLVQYSNNTAGGVV